MVNSAALFCFIIHLPFLLRILLRILWPLKWKTWEWCLLWCGNSSMSYISLLLLIGKVFLQDTMIKTYWGYDSAINHIIQNAFAFPFCGLSTRLTWKRKHTKEKGSFFVRELRNKVSQNVQRAFGASEFSQDTFNWEHIRINVLVKNNDQPKWTCMTSAWNYSKYAW